MNEKMTRQEAIDFFAVVFRGEHHIPCGSHGGAQGVRSCDFRSDGKRPKEQLAEAWAWKVDYYMGADLATWDGNLLTRLVFHAHDRCFRVHFERSGPNMLGISVSKRINRDGGVQGHPTLEGALAKWREAHPANEVWMPAPEGDTTKCEAERDGSVGSSAAS